MGAPAPSDVLTHHLAFTQRAVDTLKPRARGFVEYDDTKTPGPALRVQPTGKKTFYLTHERHAPRSSDVVRSLISRMFRFGIAAGHEDIEYNPAAGTERALDALPKRTLLSR
jgi:hypothetical protein